MVTLADKVAVKAVVADALGAEWVIPTLWHGTQVPELSDWPQPFVIKSRHGSNQNIYVRDDNFMWSALRVRAAKWMRQPYGKWLDEWLYAQIPRGVLVEPFVGDQGQLPIDYKVLCSAALPPIFKFTLNAKGDTGGSCSTAIGSGYLLGPATQTLLQQNRFPKSWMQPRHYHADLILCAAIFMKFAGARCLAK